MHDSKKLPAYKLNISDIVNNPYVKTDGEFEPNFIDMAGKLKVIRARILAKVAFKYLSDDGNYGSITLDDGRCSVRVKAWQDIKCLKETEKEDLIDIIAKVREWNGEVYLIPEVMRKVDEQGLEELRRLEILKFKKSIGLPEKEGIEKEIDASTGEKTETQEKKGEKKEEKTVKPQEEKADVNTPKENPPAKDETQKKEEKSLRVLVLEAIDKFDEGDGADFDDVIESVKGTEKEIEAIINEFLSEGTCYEPRAGKIKVL
ncbi:MAG: hypothetical protein U9O53_00510 [archaeon]|nr:hypothetical protein [archaeon]